MAEREIRVNIGGDTSGLDNALSKGQRNLRRFAAAGVAAIGATAVAMIGLTKASLANIDTLAKNARSLGLTTSALQKMTMVAGEAGVEAGQLSSMLGLMQRNIIELGDGTAAQVDAFARLGLSMKDLQGLSPDEQFRRIAESLNQIEDPAVKTATAMDIFGRSGRGAINMLDGYSAKVEEAADFQRRFNISVSQLDAEQVEKANDAVARIAMVFQGLGNTMATAVAPALIKLSEGFIAIVDEGSTFRMVMGTIAENLDAAAYSVGLLATGLLIKAVPAMYAMVTATGVLTGAMVVLRTAIITTGIGALVVAGGFLIAKFVDMSEKVGGFGNMLKLMGGVAKAVFEGIGNTLDAWVDGFRAMGEEIKGVWQAMLKFLAQGFADLVSMVGDPLNKISARIGDLGEINTMGIQAWASSFDAAVVRAGNAAEGFRTSQAEKLEGAFDGVTTAVEAMNTAIANGPMGQTTGTGADLRGGAGLLPPSEDEGDTETPIVPGLPGSGAISDQMAARLVALQDGLMTEREVVAAWYEEGKALIQNATDEELKALGGKHEAMQRLEAEHQKRLSAIKGSAQDQQLSEAAGFFGSLASVTRTGGEKTLKATQILAGAQGLINSYLAYTQALANPTLGIFGKFAAAASLLASGMKMVSAIKGVNASGGGGGVSGGGGAAPAAPQQQPATTFAFTIQNDPMGFGESFARQMIEQLNASQRNGGRIQGVLA
jgi:hypothetical protein